MHGKNFSETSRELGTRTFLVSRGIKRYNETGKTDHVPSENKAMSNPSKLSYGDSVLLETIVEAWIRLNLLKFKANWRQLGTAADSLCPQLLDISKINYHRKEIHEKESQSSQKKGLLTLI